MRYRVFVEAVIKMANLIANLRMRRNSSGNRRIIYQHFYCIHLTASLMSRLLKLANTVFVGC